MKLQKTDTRIGTSTSILDRRMRKFLASASVTLFAFMILSIYLSPFGYMITTALKDREMIVNSKSPIWPARATSYDYEGDSYSVYRVPDASGHERQLALYKKGREKSVFLDPQNPALGEITWVGKWRTLEPVWIFHPVWENFKQAWTETNMPRLLFNTIGIAGLGIFGTLISCIMVAYGFSRFRIPGKNIIFMVLISTIILPDFVKLVPTYALFQRIGWVGSWLPLVVPHFFANAYNVFLLRQFFMTIPRELDEAAMIDGAGPLRTLVSIILPQAVPAVISVALLHLMFAWNDFFGPLIYLSTERDLQPVSIGIQNYNALYFARPEMVQATALLGLILPLLVFLFAQRFFMQGLVFTGVDK